MSNSLKLEDFSDRELLFALEEHADGEGLVSSQILAESLGVSGLESPTRNVAIRLSWLKRYGVVRRDDDTKQWGLTDVGKRLLHANLKAAELRLLDEMDPDKMLKVMQHLGGSFVSAGPEAAQMAAREWRYNQAARKRRWSA